MSRQQIVALLDRYLKGETTQKENQQMERWLEEHGNPNQEWNSLDQLGKDQWLSSVFSDIDSTIRQAEVKVVPLPQRRRWWWQSVAAAAAVLLIGCTLYLEWPLLQSLLNPVRLTALQAPVKFDSLTNSNIDRSEF